MNFAAALRYWVCRLSSHRPAAVLVPLAYFPAYLQTAAQPTLAGYWVQ